MDQNEHFCTELKHRREQFSISIRRSEQDARFLKYRRMMVPQSDSDVEFRQFDESGAPINAYLLFVSCRNQMNLGLKNNNIQMLNAAASQAASAFSYTTDIQKVPFAEFLESGMVDAIFEVLQSDTIKDDLVTVRALLKLLSSMTAGPAPILTKMFDLGLLEVIDHYLRQSDTDISADIVWTISNLITDHPELMTKMIQLDWFSLIFKHCQIYSDNVKFARIMSWFYSNCMVHFQLLPLDIVG